MTFACATGAPQPGQLDAPSSSSPPRFEHAAIYPLFSFFFFLARIGVFRRAVIVTGPGLKPHFGQMSSSSWISSPQFLHLAITLSLIHISEPTRLGMISYAVFCLKKKKKK